MIEREAQAMARLTDDELRTLSENFETGSLLTAIDQLDKVRGELADGDNGEPPELRTELLRLHQLAMEVVNNGRTGQARELFELAGALEMQVFEMVGALDDIQQTLNKLTDLYPESLVYDDDEEEEAA
jgi:hypothetical protein